MDWILFNTVQTVLHNLFSRLFFIIIKHIRHSSSRLIFGNSLCFNEIIRSTKEHWYCNFITVHNFQWYRWIEFFSSLLLCDLFLKRKLKIVWQWAFKRYNYPIRPKDFNIYYFMAQTLKWINLLIENLVSILS